MAWHSGKPADNDFLSASVQHIRENFAELEGLVTEKADLLDLASNKADLLDVASLQPYLSEILESLESRIVEHNLDVTPAPTTGWYVKFANGLARVYAWGFVTGNGATVTLTQSKSLPMTFDAILNVASNSVGYKSSSDPTGPADVDGTLDRESVYVRATTTTVTANVRRVDGTAIGAGTRIVWNAIIEGKWSA